MDKSRKYKKHGLEVKGKAVHSWKTILWAIAVPAVAIVIAVFVGVAMVGFQWHLVGHVFRAQWILFVSIFALVFVLMLLTSRYSKRVLVIGLLAIAILFILSSVKGSEITENIRGFINGIFDISFLVGGITIMALALAIATISKKEGE